MSNSHPIRRTFCRRFSRLSWMFLTLFGLGALPMRGQTYDLTMDVLVNSSNTTGYNTSASAPGEYQRYPERYLEHLQIPYRVIDTATQAPPANLGQVQLIVAAHRGLSLSPAWQQAILQAVQGGSGFVNLDSDPAIGTYTHIQQIFGATGSRAGASVTSISVPSAVIPGGGSPHYIAALQLRFPSTPGGDLVYDFHQDASNVTNSITPTVLQGATGTVIAKAGTNPLILATQTPGGGRAVDFTSYDYMRPDRFGFVMGVDDLFWRSLVWAARKPFVLRGYPHFFALQLDDEVADFPTRFTDLWSTAYTGTLNGDGTGGPWKATAMAQFVDLDAGGQDRTAAIAEVKSGNLKIAFHTNTGGSEGDLYWNLNSATPLTDAQWKTNLALGVSVMQGNGGADVLPPLSKSMNPHFWNLSNNVGYDMWHTFGTRYITEIQQPGAYFNAAPAKTDNQRIAGRPFRLYELPPSYGEPNDIWPIYTADDLTVGSTAGLPPVTFFSFCTQLLGYTFPTFDAKWPSTSDGYSVSYSVDNFSEYAWRFWSSQAPVQVYSHDGGNYEKSTEAQRQQAITQISAFLNAHKVRHLFMEDLGAYMRARTKSVLSTAQASPTTLTLNFTGGALDADGNPVATSFYTYYGDDEGVSQQVPGFSNGYTFTAANNAPPSIALSDNQLTFASSPGGAASSQTVAVSNSGGGTLPFTTQTNQSWLSASPSTGVAPATLTVTADPTGLAAGTYTGNVNVTSPGAINSPQQIATTLSISSATLGVSPLSVSFAGTYGSSNPPSQPVAITNTGGGALSWTAASNVPWLQLSAASGSAPSSLSLTAKVAGLAPGSYSGSVTISSSNSQNSPQQVAVSLTVTAILMQSTFANGTLDGWAYSPLGLAANWSVANNAVSYNGGGATQLYAGNGAWTDYTAQTSFLLSSPSDYPGGLRARVDPATGAAYLAWLYPNEGVIKLLRITQWNIDGPGLQVLATSAAVSFDTTNWHTLAITLQGSQITVLYDGNSVISATDATLTAGLIALDVSNQPIRFDNILVTAGYLNTATLRATPTPLTFTVAAGAMSAAQSLGVTTNDSSAAAWSVTSTVPWLLVNPVTGSTPGSSSISVDATTLTAGTYSTALRVASFGTTNTTLSVPVTVTVTSTSSIQQTVSPSTLTYSGTVGGAAPASQTLSLQTSPTSAAYTVSSDASWLTATPASGSTPASVQVSVSPTGLAAGTYSGNITVSVPSASNPTVKVPVTFTVTVPAGSVFKLKPASLSFVGSTTTAAPSQSLALTSSPTTAVAWTNSVGSGWLKPAVTSGITPSTFQLSANSAGLAAGNYTDTLTITPSSGSGSSLAVPVALRVGTLLFSDTFTNAANWTASPMGNAAGWSVVNHTYKYNGGGATQQFAGSPTWTDYTFQTDVTLAAATDYPGGIRFRVNSSTGAGYALWLYPSEKKVVLYNVGQWNIDTKYTTLATATGITLGVGVHHLRVDAQGASIKAFVDNVQALAVTDSAYTQGVIALDVSNRVVSYSNVSVIF
ncbi:MAG: BACON domain-containing protein [Acidobacteriaceae bacterium]